jgi:arylsulfatase A-like enzyme
MKAPLACLSLLLSLVPLLPVADRPNILVIAVDDLNHWVNHLGRNPQVITPNLDRLAARGVTFTNAHTASSVCNPSRAAFLTGLRPSTSGVYGNATDWRTVIGDGYALPGFLRRQGYHTFGVGKLFHTARHIRQEDWDVYPQNPRGDDSLVQNENSNASTERGSPGQAVRYTAGDLSIAELPGGDETVGDYWTASATIAALGEQRDRPFFIGCGIFRPHLPWHVPQKYFDLYPEETIQLPPYREDDLTDVPGGKASEEHLKILKEGSWKKAIRAYLACITYADTQIGRVLDALEKSPHRDNTIVVVLGDHGWHLGEKQKWRKTGLWEEATHMPYIWAGPGIARGGRAGQPVDTMSLYPTLVELAGLARPAHVEGASIIRYLQDPAAPWDGTPALTTWQFNNHTVRTDRWRYLRWNNGNEELYDHSVDPYEWHNLLSPLNADRAAGLDLVKLKSELAAHFPKTNRTAEEGTRIFGGEQKPSAPETDARREQRRRDRAGKQNP